MTSDLSDMNQSSREIVVKKFPIPEAFQKPIPLSREVASLVIQGNRSEILSSEERSFEQERLLSFLATDTRFEDIIPVFFFVDHYSGLGFKSRYLRKNAALESSANAIKLCKFETGNKFQLGYVLACDNDSRSLAEKATNTIGLLVEKSYDLKESDLVELSHLIAGNCFYSSGLISNLNEKSLKEVLGKFGLFCFSGNFDDPWVDIWIFRKVATEANG